MWRDASGSHPQRSRNGLRRGKIWSGLFVREKEDGVKPWRILSINQLLTRFLPIGEQMSRRKVDPLRLKGCLVTATLRERLPLTLGFAKPCPCSCHDLFMGRLDGPTVGLSRTDLVRFKVRCSDRYEAGQEERQGC